MEHVKQVLERQALSTDSKTDHGLVSDEQINTINRVFGILEVNYSNQFFAAFPNKEKVDMAKKLWASKLSKYPSEVILKATNYILENNEYLPTVKHIIEACKSLSVVKKLHQPYQPLGIDHTLSDDEIQAHLQSLKQVIK